MNSYEINNLAETNGYRLSCDAAGVWSLIRKSDRQVTVVGYSIQDAVAILQPVVETVETVTETVSEAEAEAEVVETVAIEIANLSNYDIVTLAEVNGFRVSLQPWGEWYLIRKSDRQVTNIGYNLKDAVVIINPAPETFKQIEIERGYAAQEAEEHAAWVAEQQEEDVMTEDDDTMTVMMAAIILRDRGNGDDTEQEIDEAYGVMVRAVAAELRARGIEFADDSLNDWIWCSEFDGDETAENLADEWQQDNDYDVEDPDAERRARYEEEYA